MDAPRAPRFRLRGPPPPPPAVASTRAREPGRSTGTSTPPSSSGSGSSGGPTTSRSAARARRPRRVAGPEGVRPTRRCASTACHHGARLTSRRGRRSSRCGSSARANFRAAASIPRSTSPRGRRGGAARRGAHKDTRVLPTRRKGPRALGYGTTQAAPAGPPFTHTEGTFPFKLNRPGVFQCQGERGSRPETLRPTPSVGKKANVYTNEVYRA